MPNATGGPTASEIERAVNKLVDREQQKTTLPPPLQQPVPIPSAVGIGTTKGETAGGKGGGGSSSLSLGSGLTVTSSDGIFQWEYTHALVAVIDGVSYTIPAVLP